MIFSVLMLSNVHLNLLVIIKVVKKCCATHCQGNYTKDKQGKVFGNTERFEKKKVLVVCYIKDTVVCEKHWPANYLKVIYYGKERPKDSDSVFPLCKDRHVITMMLLIDEV